MIIKREPQTLTEITVDKLKFRATRASDKTQGCILWVKDLNKQAAYKALGRFNQYDLAAIMSFITKYITQPDLRQDVERRKFMKHTEKLSDGFFNQLEPQLQRNRASAYKAIFDVRGRFDRDELRMKRRIMARRFHPDIGGNRKHMAIINEAYDFLTRPAAA